METMLNAKQRDFVAEFGDWVRNVSEIRSDRLRQMQSKIDQFQPGDVFIGYHEDIVPSIILRETAKVKSFFLAYLDSLF